VETILGDAELRGQWVEELDDMRARINHVRSQLTATLQKKRPDHDFSFITRQNGMFSFSGLSGEQVETLRWNHSIYIVGSGRINVAGITSSNIDRLCTAIASVL
jgi:aspartate/tyrosine/aromatic aminotransferase